MGKVRLWRALKGTAGPGPGTADKPGHYETLCYNVAFAT